MELTFNERRVLGVLIEKGFTTPDQYPLTLNYLVNACNQKSCRNPRTGLDEGDVLDALEALRQKGLAVLVQTVGGRTDRWRHRATETLELNSAQCAILGELLLRGPQTDGELRQNARRMVPIDSIEKLHETLESLREHDKVQVLPLDGTRKRGTRYTDTLVSESQREQWSAATTETPESEPSPGAGAAAGLADLERRVSQVEAAIGELASRLDALQQPGDSGPADSAE